MNEEEQQTKEVLQSIQEDLQEWHEKLSEKEKSSKYVSDSFIRKMQVLVNSATKGELYQLLGNVVQKLFPNLSTKEEIIEYIISTLEIMERRRK